MLRYAVVVGIVFGAVTGLIIGDSWTAVWLGALGAFSSAWAVSLDWNSHYAKIEKIAKAMNVSGSGEAIWIVGAKVFRAIPFLFRDGESRRILLTCIFSLAITCGLSVNFFLASPEIVRGLGVGTSLVYFFLFILPCAVFFALGLVLTVILFALAFISAYEKSIGKKGNIIRRTTDTITTFFLDWAFQLIDSKRDTFSAFCQMVFIRFWNSIKILVFSLFVWPVFVFLELANTKTRMSAACAGILSLVHLSGSYLWWGGIDYGNMNFWLSLAVLASLGFYLGAVIHGTDFASRKRTFPKPSLLSQE